MTHHHDGDSPLSYGTHLSYGSAHEHGAHHATDHTDTDETSDPAQFWDGVYQEKEKRWSGNPNAQLVAEATELAPGTALDLGCGEGADAIWLAQHGWTVTAVDVSAVALERAAVHGTEAGTSNISWQQRDLALWRPEEQFDLVSSHFLHSPMFSWRDALSSAAGAVAEHGTLLVVGHHPAGLAPWSAHKDMQDKFFTPEDAVDALTAGPGRWRINVADSRERLVTGPEGQQAAVVDSVLRATRTSAD
ncbi:class I SAM-dependent methyltransferase [Arthrobacter sp. NyZ413]|uniref:class I SAM-dependent methyltransferase n=1 Tax=Arthrobacter sp. NyZ413 TaxID=3144669 RepID=UPI002C0835AD|nr:class I SAM-dependent methyltransferase [Arthrobacter sp.]